MPAKTERMARFMRMAQHIKHGGRIEGMSDETMDNLHRAASSMTNKQLKDFSHVATKPKVKSK